MNRQYAGTCPLTVAVRQTNETMPSLPWWHSYHLASCLLGIIRPMCRPRAAHSEIKGRALSLTQTVSIGSRKCTVCGSLTVALGARIQSTLIDRLSAIRAAKMAKNMNFFQSRNPGIKPRQSRDFGIGKVGRDSGSRDCNPQLAGTENNNIMKSHIMHFDV